MDERITVHVTRKEGDGGSRPPRAENVVRCPACGEPATREELVSSLEVCLHCDHHLPLGARERVSQLADPGSWQELDLGVRSGDPLGFFDLRSYADRLEEAQRETGLADAFLAGICSIRGRRIALGVLDFRFLGGSMGIVVGESFARLTERAADEHLPLVVVTASGGARMQEGMLSLMQMAKTVCALEVLAERGLPFISILSHPTTGGVLASFASLADVIMAEPGALLCFAGPRVIEQTTREKLPYGFGRAESTLDHGQLDMVVPRKELRAQLSRVLTLLEGGVSYRLECVRQDTEVIPWGSRTLAQAAARAKGLAVVSWDWLLRRNSKD